MSRSGLSRGMNVPNLAIPKSKLTEYLLDLNGREPSKARYFLSRGFTMQTWFSLADALAKHAVDNWPGHVISTSYGHKRVVTGGMECPDGSVTDILAVWMVATGITVASLVTAYPNRT
jgi:hypothetical protein